ncbi:MAG: hypothetical protein E4H36_08490 [Spirochaetales bacterium]|nr:MAG: hypothetical protein E4H36_08490 [Spirochaetales bacterium]
MEHITVLFFDQGASLRLPGFSASCQTSIFPVWGTYTFLDIAMVNTASEIFGKKLIFARKEKAKTVSAHLQLWEAADLPIFPADISVEQFSAILNEAGSDHFLFYDVSQVFLLNPDELVRAAVEAGKDTVKISLNDIPLDMYIITKKKLKSGIQHMTKIGAGKKPLFEFLFFEVLADAFEILLPLQGEAVLLNNIADFYHNNMRVLSRNFNGILNRLLYAVPQAGGTDTLISKNGWVRNSFISPGGRVDGYVENSVIFSNVHIKEKSSVINSIIMNGNQVGRNSTIINAIVFPFMEDTQALNTNTIGDHVTIGFSGSKANNRDFPDQIREGLTVIGLNPSIPDNCVVEPGCFIDADVSPARIKSIKLLKKGNSLLRESGDLQ